MCPVVPFVRASGWARRARRPPDLPPHPRVDRGPPDRRVRRRPRRQPLDRDRHRLVSNSVTTARCYRTITNQAGDHTLIAADPSPRPPHRTEGHPRHALKWPKSGPAHGRRSMTPWSARQARAAI